MLMTRNNWLPQVFNEIFNGDIMPRTMASTKPAINVIENSTNYEVQIAAPGMSREDFTVTLNEEQNLVVNIEKKAATEAAEKETGRFLRREFSYTKYSQTLLLPEDVDREGITASSHDGILTIMLPKVKHEEKKIEVKQITIN
ncbi:MAG: Hsp20/alpha crystallin family protein [Muribaculaceae bacterium]|nr:Hsp20/alpha crystallin family protein [Muribaculaceae bacterium]